MGCNIGFLKHYTILYMMSIVLLSEEEPVAYFKGLGADEDVDPVQFPAVYLHDYLAGLPFLFLVSAGVPYLDGAFSVAFLYLAFKAGKIVVKINGRKLNG